MSTQNKVKEESVQKVLKGIDAIRPEGAQPLTDMSKIADEMQTNVESVIGIDPRTTKPQTPQK
jgi:hypothetical protein